MADRSVSVSLIARVAGFQAGIATAAKSVKDFRGELDGLHERNRARFNDLSQAAGGAGLVLAGAFAYAAKAAADFDRQMSAVNAVTNGSAQELDRLRAAALEAGKATQYSATQAAQAEEELAKAGISTADILGGALNGSLALAAAGSLDLAEAADISAKAMNVFGLTGQNVGHIADVLSASANKSATDVHEMGEALRMGGLVAKQAGLSLEDTVGVLSAFADRALVGSDAGTSLKTMLQMVANPTVKASGLMKELGINLYDAQGNFVGVEKMAGILQDRLGGLTQQQRQAALATLFGADAVRGAGVLYEIGAKGVREYRDAVDDQGAAAETARKKTDNLAGDIERLKGSLETLAIEAGSGANSGLRILVQAVDGLVDNFSRLPGPVQTTLTVLSGVGGAGLLATAGLLKVKATAGEALQALRDMGPTGERAATGLGRLGSVVGRIGLIGAGVGLVFAGLEAFGDWVERKHAPVKADIDKLTVSLKDFADSGKIAGELAGKYGENLQKIGQDVSSVTKGMADLAQTQADVAAGLTAGEVGANWNPVDPAAVQRIKDLDTALAQMVAAGGASQARIALDQLRSSGALTDQQFAQLTGMLPQYNQAAQAAAAANSGLAQGFGSVGANAQTLIGSLQEAIEKGQTLLDVWKQLNGATLSFDESQLRVRDALDKAKQSFADNGREIDGNSRKALENRVAVGQAAQAAADAAQRKLEETGSIQLANDVYNQYIGQLRKTLHQAGLTDAQIDTLIATYAKLPEAKSTTVTANTAPAIGAVNSLVARINGMKARISVGTAISGEFGGPAHSGFGYSTGNRWGGIYEHAAAGLLRQAKIAAPSGPARYAWAEPSTGGELFAPRYGDMDRTRALVGYAIEHWWGGWQQFAPSAGTAAAPAPSGPGPMELAQAIRSALVGVSVQMDGRTVGYIQGREANLLSR